MCTSLCPKLSAAILRIFCKHQDQWCPVLEPVLTKSGQKAVNDRACLVLFKTIINLNPFNPHNNSLGVETDTHFADGDCSHEIKRRLLLGRKVITNLDSIFKSRDITFPTKVRLVKAMVFPVVMYGCESWTVKKAESRRIDAFEL